jgi:hypothetical protein
MLVSCLRKRSNQHRGDSENGDEPPIVTITSLERTFQSPVLALRGTQKQNVDFVESGFTGQTATNFDSRHYQKKKVVGLGRGPLSLVTTTEELLDRKVAAPV